MKNQPGTMTNQSGTMKNDGNQPKTPKPQNPLGLISFIIKIKVLEKHVCIIFQVKSCLGKKCIHNAIHEQSDGLQQPPLQDSAIESLQLWPPVARVGSTAG